MPLYFANDLRAQTYGVEVSLDLQVLEGWHLHGGYDWLKEQVWAKPGRLDLFNGYNETADPENQVFLRSSMDLPLGSELDLAFRWIDLIHPNDGPVRGTIWDYAELDVRLGLHATSNVEFAITGRNLLNERHAESGFPGSKQEWVLPSVQGKATLRF